MKKIFTPFLFIVATLLLCSTTVKGEGGTTDDGLSWDLTDGVLTISGTGAMRDYATSTWGGGKQSPWYTFKESVTKIIVNEGVTALGTYAFYKSINCTEISLPSTLTDIKTYALSNCSTVTKITCKASTPPTLPAPTSTGKYQCFQNVPTDCPIYVPKQSVNTYKATAGWSTFTNYQELEEGAEGGGDSPVLATPTITVSKSSLNMGKFIPGYTTASKTFTVTGRDLTDDITLAVSGSAITIDKTTITKEDAVDGVTVTVALAPTANAPFEETITIVSTGADNKTITVTGDLMGQQNIAKLSDLSGNAMDDILYTYTGNTATVLSSTTDELILKDNGAAFTVNVNEALAGKLPVGVAIKVKNFTFTAFSQFNVITEKYTYTLTPITIDFETEYIRIVDKVGKYGTICLPYNVSESKRTGATFYKIAYKDLANSVIVLEEVGDMEAGVPYIFHSSALEIVCNYGIDYASDASSYNGLIGSFEQREISDGHDNYYVLHSNQLWKAGSGVSVGANRAYIDIRDVCEVGEAPSQAPGRKRVTMAVEGEQTSTNIHNISTTQGTAEKVLINGSLYIMRDGTIYNISGQIVK